MAWTLGVMMPNEQVLLRYVGGPVQAAVQPVAPSYEVVAEDCLSFLRTLPAASVDVITTDPAYSGMNQHMQFGHGRIVGRYEDAGAGGKWFREFHDDPETFRVFLRECHRVLKDDRHIYIMFDSFSLLSLGHIVRDVFDVKNLIVWDKVNLGMGHYFRRRFEVIIFASKGKRKLSRRDLQDVWPVKRLHRARYPTQKPVALFERMLSGSVDPGFVVCDPFVGAGSAAVAALKHNCSFIGADVAQRAVQMTNDRCATFMATGEDPLEYVAERATIPSPLGLRLRGHPREVLSPSVRFQATVELGGKTATGIAVPDEVVAALGPGKRPAVQVTVAGHSYRTTVASLGRRFLIPLSADNRAAAGVNAGDEVEVEMVLDVAPREVSVPGDLAQALAGDPTALAAFDALPYSHRKEWVRWIEEAKKAHTRESRVTQTLSTLRTGKPSQ